jgi:hypothetical protein
MTIVSTEGRAAAFLALIKPVPRNPHRTVEGDEYVSMMFRMIRALEARTIEDPALLTHVIALAQRLAEVVNVSIAANAERYAVDPKLGASMMECARLLGITKQSASERRTRGDSIMAERLDAAGVTKLGDKPTVRHAEAGREREIIERATEHAVTNLADYRARHAA